MSTIDMGVAKLVVFMPIWAAFNLVQKASNQKTMVYLDSVLSVQVCSACTIQ